MSSSGKWCREKALSDLVVKRRPHALHSHLWPRPPRLTVPSCRFVAALHTRHRQFLSFKPRLTILPPTRLQQNRLTWNNGRVEGKVNRLKLIKRSMYGRTNCDLLRKRVL